MKKKLLHILLILILLCPFAIWGLSPYKKHDNLPYKAVVATVEINAAPEKIFAYLGNSANAGKWSVYVDHITPLNNDSIADGLPGSRRRCFQEKDETGIRWDETITASEPNKRRQLIIYDLQNFPMTSKGLSTEQIYVPLDNGTRCRLTFTLFYDTYKPSVWELIKMYVGAWKVRSVFEENIANVKRNLEQ
jgi:uncharacterized protein YndB with AHSA1/START domain